MTYLFSDSEVIERNIYQKGHCGVLNMYLISFDLRGRCLSYLAI